MRLGTTSFIIPADILPNAHFLKRGFDDIELLIFEHNKKLSPLPGHDTLRELAEQAESHDLTYSVHLPLDLHLARQDWAPGAARAAEIITHMESINPSAFITHLDSAGKTTFGKNDRDNCISAVERLCQAARGPELICIENLEHHSLEFMETVLNNTPASLCLDMGHLWKTGEEPLIWLNKWFERIRVIHIHGVKDKDHKSLDCISRQVLRGIFHELIGHYKGILTIEVFNGKDLRTSLVHLQRSLKGLRSIKDGDCAGLFLDKLRGSLVRLGPASTLAV